MTTGPIICAGCKHGYVQSALYCPNCGRPKSRETPTDALIGKVLGERFVVHELLGQGASGTIYRAEHVTLRRKVAIKVLHDELSRDDLAVERFRREATTVAEIDNEHIVEIHDFGRTPDGRLYLAMELLEGETLDGVLERERTLSVERTADILIQVGEALMEAHAIGYVHRDLRPRNIYLAQRRGKANFVKLLDFGLAKLVETDAQAASTSLGMTFGDPRYMSPEQARGDRIDRRADIYQLGCVAYEMLTSAPPFSGNRVFDILTKQVSEIPAPLPTRRPGVPLWMEAAVAKMLAKDPENRFATTTRMVEALRRGLDSGEVMDDEVARRRESIPPPSVSRVMEKLGIGLDGVPTRPTPPGPVPPNMRSTQLGQTDKPLTAPAVPAPAAPPPAAPPAAAAPAFDPRATQLGHDSAPAAAPAAQAEPAFDPRATKLGRDAAPSGPGASPQAFAAPSSSPVAQAQPAPQPQSAPLVAPVPMPVPVPPPMVRASTGPAGVPAPVPVRRPTAPPPVAPAPPGVSTAPPEMPSPITQAMPAMAAAPVAEARRRTGTPRVGVPVVPSQTPSRAAVTANLPAAPAPAADAATGAATGDDQVDPNQQPVAGMIDAPPERSDRARKPTNDPSAISQVWYEDEEPGKPRKLSSVSTADLYLDDDEHQPRSKAKAMPFVLVGAAVLVIGGAVALALGVFGGDGGSSSPSQPASQPIASAPMIDAAPATVIPTDTPDAAAPVAATDGSAKQPATTTTAPAHVATSPAQPSTSGSSPTLPAPPHTTLPVPGSSTNDDDPALRRPHIGDTAGTPPQPPGHPGVSGNGPLDPYGEGSAKPDDSTATKADFYANLGTQQLGNGDIASAAVSFKKAADLDPKNAAAAIGLGEIAVRQGLYGDAVAHLNRAAKLAPKNAKIYTLLGEAYLNSGQNKLAADNFKKALQIDPDNARARDGFNEASSRVPPPQDDQP
jgi:serine/threonine-protein kinase|nr:protein kinase [Kofleriaceae bacterium]